MIIKNILFSLDTSKTAEIDKIPNKFLMDRAEVLALVLLLFFYEH